MHHDSPRAALAATPGSDAARITMTTDAVLAVLRQHFTGLDSMVLCPEIPGKKELAARAVHAAHLPNDERVLALFDESVFGSGDEGFIVTARRLCWKNPRGGRAQSIEWQHIESEHMYADGRRLVLGTLAIELTSEDAASNACEAAFHVLAFSARAAATSATSAMTSSGVVLAHEPDARAERASQRAAAEHEAHDASERPTYRPSQSPAKATPPPPHAVTYDSYVVHASSQRGPSFACWHCQTPLHWNTPQCARCGASPSPQGWRRTP